MKVIVCNSCKKIIDDPHKVQMKEFYYFPSYENGHVYKVGTSRKTKIHLCDDCFNNLQSLASNEEEKKDV